MKCNFCKATKLCFVVALSLIVVGMVLFGIFGFNKSVDNRLNYEVAVGVDQNIGEAGEKVKSTSEKYFEEVGVDFYKVQVVDNGRAYIYTFAENVIDTGVLQEKIQTAVGDVVVASCDVVEVRSYSSNQAINVLIALSIASAIIIVYLLIVDKAATTFTVLFNAIFSSILCFALLALTRVPVVTVEIYVVASFALSAVASIVLTSRLREIKSLVGNEKLSYIDVVAKGIKESKLRLGALLLLTVLASIVIAIALTPDLLSMAVCVLILGVASVFASVVGTAIIWPILKGLKK